MMRTSRLALVAVVVLVLAAVAAPVLAYDYGSPCYMAEQFGGKSLYYNVLCFFEWLITWT